MRTLDNASPGSTFKDHFSGHSGSYAEFRPRYPDKLFGFLAECCRSHSLAWDCATGNGQAAVALTAYFERVIASDASQTQIAEAEKHESIEYRVARAETSGLDDHSIDLITVAQAMHWFDISAFVDEANRVLAPGGILAIWSYQKCRVNAACDDAIDELYLDIVDTYWPPERRIVEDGYRSIELPMPPIDPPEFSMQVDWTAADMLGYLRTWSASQRYLKERRADPVSLIEARLRAAWGEGRRTVSWPLNVKVGRA